MLTFNAFHTLYDMAFGTVIDYGTITT